MTSQRGSGSPIRRLRARWVTCGPCPVETDAPALVALRLRHNPSTGALQVALSNYAQSQIYTAGFSGHFTEKGPSLTNAVRRQEIPRHVSPVSNVHVRVPWPHTGKPIVETLSGEPPNLRRVEQYLELTVRELNGRSASVSSESTKSCSARYSVTP